MCWPTAWKNTTAPAPARCSVFGHQMRFDLGEGFPLVTTKKLHLKSIIYELLWFLRGETNVKYLNDHGVRSGTNGRTRTASSGRSMASNGARGRRADGRTIDQIANVVEEIRRNPDSRRLIVSAWNPARCRQDGAAAVPLPVPVLCREGQALVPALSALGRHLPRRAVQHRVLRAADDDGGAGDGSQAGRIRPHLRRRASLRQSHRAGASCNFRASRARCRR